MNKTISALAMRDRLLARLQAPRKSDDWVRVLGTPGHRELLALIAHHRPPSVGALAELAGRAQPNVSRALNALVSAGLVEVVSHGRRSIPRITEVGAVKVRDLGLIESSEDHATATGQAAELFSIDVAEGASSIKDQENDAIDGLLTCWLWRSSSEERVAARTETDLDVLGRRVLENWWRMLYRRDAPFRLWDFALEDDLPGSSYALLATVAGSKLNLSARAGNGRTLDLQHASKTFLVNAFEELLLDELLRPLAARHWLQGRSARPLHALLARIEDSRNQPAERAFCHTAGALGLMAYDLGDGRAAQIRDLLEFIPEEDARLDFSSAVLADALGAGQSWTSEQLTQFRQRNAMPALAKLRAQCSRGVDAPVPFRHGYDLARNARAIVKLADDQPLGGVEGLSKLLGAGDGIGLSPEAPGSLRAFQSFDNGFPTIIVEDEGPRSSAFILARGVGDFLAFGSRAACVADLYTDRQAVGRAFAAEFMAPRGAVVHMIEEEDQSIAQIADHFGVSFSVVRRQYENSFR